MSRPFLFAKKIIIADLRAESKLLANKSAARSHLAVGTEARRTFDAQGLSSIASPQPALEAQRQVSCLPRAPPVCETCGRQPQKAPSPRAAGLVGVLKVSDDDLLSPGRTRLSSARARFTVLFEMGRSGSTPLWSSDLTGDSRARTADRGPRPVPAAARGRSKGGDCYTWVSRESAWQPEPASCVAVLWRLSAVFSARARECSRL